MSTAAAASDAEQAPPPKSKKKLIIILAAVLVLAAVGGAGAVFYLKQKAKAEAQAMEDADEAGHGDAHGGDHAAKKDPKSLPVFMAIEAFTVNLADHDGSRYAQVAVSLELDDAKTTDLIKAYMPAIRNNVIILLSQKTYAQLLDPQGKVALAKEIQREVLKPLGVEMEDEAVEEASEKAEKTEKTKKKKSKRTEPQYPVRSVHFSNFIIQ